MLSSSSSSFSRSRYGIFLYLMLTIHHLSFCTHGITNIHKHDQFILLSTRQSGVIQSNFIPVVSSIASVAAQASRQSDFDAKYMKLKTKLKSTSESKITSQYMNLRLLTKEEECKYGKISGMGKKLAIIKAELTTSLGREPTMEEWTANCNISADALKKYIAAAFKARNMLIIHNMRLVEYTINNIMNISPKLKKHSYTDILSEGIVGLSKASEHYDGRYRFITFAQYYIKDAVCKAITRLQPGALLTHHEAMLNNRARKLKFRLTAELGRDPTDQEIASQLNITVQLLHSLRKRAARTIISDSIGSSSMQKSSSDNEQALQSYFDLDLSIGQSSSDSIDNLVWSTNFKTALSCLDPFDLRVLSLRYGLSDGFARPIAHVAELMCVTEEGIRQSMIRAFDKLKASQHVDILLERQPEPLLNSLSNKMKATKY